MNKNNLIYFLLISIIIIPFLFICCLPVQNDEENDNSGKKRSKKRSDKAYLINIPLSGSLQNPAWSPDAKSLLFTRFRNGYNEEPADIYIIDLETEELKCLVSDNSGNINLPGTVWKSNSIVFSSSRDPHDEIFLIADDGTPGMEVQITQRNGFVAYEPSFSFAENFIVFESHVLDDEENGVIIKKDLSLNISSGFISLTDSSTGDCRQPNWAPDGQHILYQRVNNNKWDIWIMNKDGSNKNQVTTGEGDNTDASFSPDSQRIIFSGDGELDYANLYIILASGGGPKRLTNFNGGYDGAPSWSVNNNVAFESCKGDPDESSGTKIWIINIPDDF